MTDNKETAATIKRPRKMAREPKSCPTAQDGTAVTAPARRASKSGLVLALLQRPEAATIDQLVAATGWLPHTTRAALTGLKKGHVVTSDKVEGQGRVYRVVVAG